MTDAARRRLAIGLAALALVGAGAAVFDAVGEARERGRSLRVLEAKQSVDGRFRGLVRRIDALADRVSEAYVDEVTRSDAAAALPWESRLLERVRGFLADERDLREVAIVLYETLDGGAVPSFRPQGRVTAGRVEPPATLSPAVRVPTSILRAEYERPSGDPWDPGTVYFALEDGAVRLHKATAYSLVAPPEAGEDADDVIRFVDVSVPYRADDATAALEVECDVRDGAIESSRPRAAVPGSAPMAQARVVATTLDPKELPWHFPGSDRSPRAHVGVWVADPGPLHWALWGAPLVLALAALAVGRTRPGKGTPAPDVTGEAAHEMRTPLTVMRGALEVALRRDREPGEYRETIAACLEEVKGLQGLLNSVLLLTRGRNAARADEPVDLAAVVRAEVDRVRGSAPDRDVTLAAGPATALVRGDPSLLARAVGNLLDNAVLHSVQGGGIRGAVLARDGRVQVVVEDDGPGIPEARREKVFERFYRGPEVGTRGIPGAGLGLPIARWIAENHGGRLVLDASVAGRARFVLDLPAARDGRPVNA